MNKSEYSLFTEIRGNKHCLIEGVDKLIRYDDKTIAVEADKTILSITGTNLTLDLLSENRIGIKGNIKSVTFGDGNDV